MEEAGLFRSSQLESVTPVSHTRGRVVEALRPSMQRRKVMKCLDTGQEKVRSASDGHETTEARQPPADRLPGDRHRSTPRALELPKIGSLSSYRP